MLSYPPPPSELLDVISSGTILAETGPTTTTKIQFHGVTAVLKYGPGVQPNEAVNVKFVQSVAPDIPVPSVLGVWYSDAKGDMTACWYVLTEWVEAQNLEVVWPQMESSAKLDVADQLRHLLQRLRSLPPQGGTSYIGSVDGYPCSDHLVRDMGPYKDVPAFTAGLLEIARPYFKWHYIDIVERMLARTHDYRILFTHGDLHISNILVRPNSTNPIHWDIAALIDWECSGWYPEHWEYVKLLNGVKWKSDWAGVAQDLLERKYDEDFMLDTRLRFHHRL